MFEEHPSCQYVGVLLTALKLVLAPALVTASSLAGRRWGPAVAGMLVAAPVVLGPVLLVVYLDHGARFVSQAAASSLLGLVSLTVFACVVARLCPRSPWALAMAGGWAACLLADWPLSTLRPSALLALAAAGTAICASLVVVRPARRASRPAPTPLKWDLPARAMATGGLVAVLTLLSARLGPALTGVLAPFPVATSVVTGFALAQEGPAAGLEVLRGLLTGTLGLALFCLVLAVLIRSRGPWVAFTLATAAGVGPQLVVQTAILYRRRRAAPRPLGDAEPVGFVAE